jgi:hypothetical protein
MNLIVRTITVFLVLAAALAGQNCLQQYLAEAGAIPPLPLTKSLAELPWKLGKWRGEDLPIDDARQLYGDDYVQRTYWDTEGNQVLSIWIVYSRDGQDRGHHPEVCMGVAGKMEDVRVRQTVDVPGHEQPVQQYRFGQDGESVWVYYWHYTLPSPKSDELDAVQRAYQKLHVRPASMTLEVFAPERASTDVAGAQDFVRLVDAAIQDFVGPTAVRGSHRLPVTVINRD